MIIVAGTESYPEAGTQNEQNISWMDISMKDNKNPNGFDPNGGIEDGCSDDDDDETHESFSDSFYSGLYCVLGSFN